MMSASKAKKDREDQFERLAVLTANDRARGLRLRAALTAGFLFAQSPVILAQTPPQSARSTNAPRQPAASPPTASGPAVPKDAASPAADPAQTAGSAATPSGGDTSEPTPQHIEKARQLILATGISRSFQIIIPEFMAQIGSSLTQSRPELIDDMNKVLDQLRPEFDKQSDEMIDQSARIYAKLLSEKDIDAVLAFFNSEAGRRYVGAQPLFLNQLVSGMQAWQQKISTTMMARVREEMKKKGHDL